MSTRGAAEMSLFTFATHVFEASTALRNRCSADLADMRRTNCAWAKRLVFFRAACLETYRHVLVGVLDLLV